MKKGLIVLLACVNAGLLLTLILGTGTPPAQAQGGFLQTDFLAVPCQVSSNEDALFILDLAKERLSALRIDTGKKNIVPYRFRSLSTDFTGKEK
ncbi:MAG: hypothetical protein NTV86_16310 [Planctomycetota bacterium]|nr:hypothetical protein [Planctomycetota bacterium]